MLQSMSAMLQSPSHTTSVLPSLHHLSIRGCSALLSFPRLPQLAIDCVRGCSSAADVIPAIRPLNCPQSESNKVTFAFLPLYMYLWLMQRGERIDAELGRARGLQTPPVGIPSAVRGTSVFLPLAFHLNVIGAAPLILNPVRRPPPRAHGTCGIHTYPLPVLPMLQLPHPLPPQGKRQSCAAGRCQRTRPPTGLEPHGSTFVRGCGPQQTSLGELEGRGDEEKEVWERRDGVVCNSLLAPLHHFIQHLVKQDLFCFASAAGNARRSQFVGSFVKRWTASEASRRPRRAERSSLPLCCRGDENRASPDCQKRVPARDGKEMQESSKPCPKLKKHFPKLKKHSSKFNKCSPKVKKNILLY